MKTQRQRDYLAVRELCRFTSIVTAVIVASLPLALRARERGTVPSRSGLLIFVGMPDARELASAQADWHGLVQVLVERTGEKTELNMRLPATEYGRAGDGRTTFLEFDGSRLPFCENSVNRLVVTGATRVPRAEQLRVLAPRASLVSVNGDVAIKPWPAAMDEWTHGLHDATNNAVADDTLVGPPDCLQWIGTPDYCRHHNFLASVSATVSARGRLFTIVDEGPLVSDYLPPKWTLSARDAFNGILLWKRVLPDWGPRLRNFRSGPAEIGRPHRFATNGRIRARRVWLSRRLVALPARPGRRTSLAVPRRAGGTSSRCAGTVGVGMAVAWCHAGPGRQGLFCRRPRVGSGRRCDDFLS